MNCYKCATPLPDNSRFCLACGADVSGESHVHEKTLAVDADPELLLKLQADVGNEYIIEKELGRGGMAIVFLGHDAALGRKVAVKMLPPELTFGAGPSVIERFKREARTSATLDHPNIIPVYRVSQGQKLFWYVMKYLDGEALDDILAREGQLAVDRMLEIIRQTAEALDYAHQNQVIHRDIKPANLMIDARGRVTVTDFGIAKALDASTLTASGSMIGTPYYMSPEQCAGKRVGPASDQYSLAVMTYLMLGAHLPFTGDSVVDIIRKHVMDPVPPLSVLRPNLPPALVRVIERGLAKSPDERFASCAAFAKALGQAAQGMDVTAAGKPASGARMSKTALVSPVPGALRTAKSHKGAVLLGGAGVAVAALVAALTWSGRNNATPGQQEGDSGAATATQLAVGTPPTGAADSSKLALSDTTPTPAAASPVALNPPPPPPAAAPRPVTRPVAAPIAAPATPPVVNPQPPPAAPQSAPAPSPGVGYLTFGTNPRSTVYVNGQAVAYPLRNQQVPAGTVRLRFQVADTSGLWWAQDRDVAVRAGDTVRLGFIPLARP